MAIGQIEVSLKFLTGWLGWGVGPFYDTKINNNFFNTTFIPMFVTMARSGNNQFDRLTTESQN